jgi:integrase
VRGHVRKRGNTWAIVYDEGHDENGKRVQRWRGGFATQKEAQAFLTETLGGLGKGTYVTPSKLTLIDYLEGEWLPAIEAAGELAPLTVTTYKTIVKTRIKAKPWLASLPLQQVSSGHVKRLLGELKKDGLSESSCNMARATLSGAFADAIEDRKLTSNPAAIRKRRHRRSSAGPGTKARVKAWSARELRKFLEHVADDRLFALWRLGAITGMRRGELLGLPWRNLDLDGASLRVEQQLVPTRGGASFGPPKTERSRRTIKLDPGTVHALKHHLETQRLDRALAGDAYEDHDLVFCNELGAPIHPQTLTYLFSRITKAAKLGEITLHGLRHTHATHLLTEGVPLHVVAARLGDRPEIVLKTYAHLLPTSDEEAANRAASLVA